MLTKQEQDFLIRTVLPCMARAQVLARANVTQGQVANVGLRHVDWAVVIKAIELGVLASVNNPASQ